MFGGIGLYYQERFFAIIVADTVYFKVSDAARGDYESRGMDRFRPFPDRPRRGPDRARLPDPDRPRMAYYEVPADVLEDPEECVAWARRAIAAASVSGDIGAPI
jgi:DNA transformation protein